MTETAEYQNAIGSLQEAYKESLRSFADYFEKNWKFESEEEWKKSYAEPYPGNEWIKGHNIGISAVHMALDVFLDEFY